MFLSWLKRNWSIVIILFFAAVIMLPGLSRPCFWQDEADSALLARSILHNGIPKAFDGTNVITQLSGNDFNSDYIWTFTPWFPFYIIAGSFKMLGESTFAGRLPFVIFGLLSLVAVYLLAYCLSRSRMIAGFSSLLLLLNMQFILYSRQCKYYSLMFLIPPVMYLLYMRLRKDLPAFIFFIICVVLIFYTNFVSLFTAMVGLTIYTFFVKRHKKQTLTFIAAGIISLALTLPFFLLSDLGTASSLITRLPSIAEYFDKLARHIWYFNNMVFGLVIFIPLWIYHRKGFFTDEESKLIKFLLWIIIPAWLALPFLNQDVFRYNIHLLPLFSILMAIMICAFLRRSKLWGAIFLVLILTTNIFSNFPTVIFELGMKISGTKFGNKTDWVVKTFNKDEEKMRKYFNKLDLELAELSIGKILTHSVLRSEYAAYFNQLRGNYPDAIADTVTFLKANAKDGDAVYANFDLLPLQFYLPKLRYVYAVDPAALVIPNPAKLPKYLTSLDEVNWYFARDERMNLGPFISKDDFFKLIKERGRKLVPHDLKVSSLYWDINWPQRYNQYINKMLWRDLRGYEDVVIYEVK